MTSDITDVKHILSTFDSLKEEIITFGKRRNPSTIPSEDLIDRVVSSNSSPHALTLSVLMGERVPKLEPIIFKCIYCFSEYCKSNLVPLGQTFPEAEDFYINLLKELKSKIELTTDSDLEDSLTSKFDGIIKGIYSYYKKAYPKKRWIKGETILMADHSFVLNDYVGGLNPLTQTEEEEFFNNALEVENLNILIKYSSKTKKRLPADIEKLILLDKFLTARYTHNISHY